MDQRTKGEELMILATFLVGISVVSVGSISTLLYGDPGVFSQRITRSFPRNDYIHTVIDLLAMLAYFTWSIAMLSLVFAIGLGMISPLPWVLAKETFRQDGLAISVLCTCALVLFLMWAFFLPARLHTADMYEKTGERLIWPWIVNALVGLLICTPNNPLIAMIDFLADP